MKRILSFVLALAMLMSLAACGAPAPKENAQTGGTTEGTVSGDADVSGGEDNALSAEEELDREDKELVLELVGGQDGSALSNEELDALVDQLLQETTREEVAQIVDLSNTGSKEEQPSVDVSENKDAYDENGAMTVPFDQVYPELIEQEQVSFSGESVLVKLASDTLTDGLKAAGIGALEEIVPMEDCSWYEAKLVEGTEPEAALAAVRELDEVLLAEYNYEVQTAALDSYKDFGDRHKDQFGKNEYNKDQWHMHHCGIPDAYEQMETNGGDSSVIVAVIDSGVDYDHEDLKDNMWVNAGEIPDNGCDDDGNGYVDDYYGVDIVAGSGNGDDTNGHGTHVAGIIAAQNNNLGVVGMAYNVKIMSVKAAMHNGTLNQADIAKAVLYAYNHGAEVINMSFGGTACSIAVQDALATAYTRCVLVASAGNSGVYNEGIGAIPNYPAALTYVLGVMSVDETGRESAFTNWDVFSFNGVEYELYAPGENIMSTLPGDQYGYLSGTSMAAPVVSAMAAILRSEFSDRDKYPTKFIYGQLASTSGNCAECLDPELHGLHNLPQIANLYDALTKLPKPEVNLQEYYLFDDPAYSDKNNGDGVIDAGETIALGLVLRNRWGMSENTMVTIDTISAASGMADPYFTIQNPTVNYGSVGTYSTQDCGRVYTDELLTGWENPFLIEVSEDCPNDYRFTLNVTITCENALDAADTAVYTSTGEVNENVRSGYVVPSVIEEDMVWTKENLYIIPNATIISEGVTVKVEPGTHIQFWSDDANDPYADSYIAYLVVNGSFLVEGTREEPVYIYPSQLMDRYNVEIGSTSRGYVSLKYADITNFGVASNNTGTINNVDIAEHCTFRNNYGTGMSYRYLSGGVVRSSYSSGVDIGCINAKDCVFYKLGLYSGQSLYGTADRCVFTQCGIRFYGDSYENCVFLGNSFVDQTYPGHYNQSSRYAYDLTLLEAEGYDIYYRAETGTTYIYLNNWEGREETAEYLCRVFDASPLILEDDDEYQWLKDRGIFYYNNHTQTISGYGEIWYYAYDIGVVYDHEAGCYTLSNGQPLPEFMDLSGLPENYTGKVGMNPDGITCRWGYCRTLYEIPGPILPTDIIFPEYTVDMDMETTYQLQPQNPPVQLPLEQFLYESSDESVITVSETGLVTPVGLGTADVWVYSLDRAVKNRVTFTVKDYVALESIAFSGEKVKLAVGNSASAKCILTPADTTRRTVTYTSSDPSVVTVKNGVLTALSKGAATITATCEGITATMEVVTWVKATGLYSGTYYHTRAMEDCDTSLPALKVTPANADLDLEWRSDSESVLTVENGRLVAKKAGSCYLYVTDKNSGLETYFHFTVTASGPVICEDVITAQVGAEPIELPACTLAEGAEVTPQWKLLDPGVAELKDGKICFNGAGITTLRLTDSRTGLTDEVFLYVTEGETPRVKEIYAAGGYYSYYLALMEDGSVYYWSSYDDQNTDPVCLAEDVKCVYKDYYNEDCSTLLFNDNTVVRHRGSYQYGGYALPETLNITDLTGHYYKNGSSYSGSMQILTESGEVYAIGDNTYGVLGVGGGETLTELTQVVFPESVVQIERYDNTAYYLTESGCLYISGGNALQSPTPVMIARNVTWLNSGGVYYMTDNRLGSFRYDATAPTTYEYDYAGYTPLAIDPGYGSIEGLAVKDGVLYTIYSGNISREAGILHLDTVKAAAVNRYNSGRDVILTEEGMLFVTGRKSEGDDNDFLGMTNDTTVPGTRPLLLPLVQSQESLSVVDTNLEDGILREDALRLTFNKQLQKAVVTIYEDEIPMVMQQSIDGEYLRLTPSLGFVEGSVYRIAVVAATTSGISNVYPEADIVFEFTYETPEAAPEETVPAGDILDEIPDADTSVDTEENVVVYEAITDGTVERYLTSEIILREIREYIAETQHNVSFYNNAILNPISTDFEVSHWLRIQAGSVNVGDYEEIPLGGNWWGSVNERAIGLQMIDYTDFPNYARLMYAPYLTEAPENTFPFVTSVKLFNKYGEEVTTVGNEEVTFQVKFNRDMDTSIPLLVRFGSAYPYGDYEVAGEYVDARTWEGTYTLNTLIENGYQYFTISNGCSATEDLELQLDQYRFFFEIDTTAAQALIMQGTATDTGIQLKWTQDDFDTLMGYNVYRSTSEDGYYTRLNSTVIPADTMEWFDDTVEPGKIYYYNFTVVQTDMTESEPSGKIVIMSKDTMAPNIYHSPVANAFTGANLVLGATITDNLNIAYANLYYRVAGTDTWNTVRMNKLNDQYSAIIPAAYITVDGLEYYIEAFDGVSYTYKGSADAPYTVTVQEAIDANALGDVDGDGVITNLDALLLLYTINDKYNMTAEEFARADLNGDGELWAAEALRILQYVSGVVGSVKM